MNISTPILENGDQLSRYEFEQYYQKMPLVLLATSVNMQKLGQ